ncbi:MAG: PepSY-like domain-containing protein [Rikenellaceae bacterium]
MKKLLYSLVVVLLSINTLAAEERVIDQEMLPKSAKSFIEKNYPSDKISIATMERGVLDKDYKVILTSGVKIEFDKSGNWSEIECKRNSEVPMDIIPEKIVTYVKAKFPNNKVLKVEKDHKSIELELDNDLELKFNKKGDLVEVDN